MGAGQLEIAAAETVLLAASAVIFVTPVAMDFDLGHRNVLDDVFLDDAGRRELIAAAMRTLGQRAFVLLGDILVLGFGPKRAGMLPLGLGAAINGWRIFGLSIGAGTIALALLAQQLFQLGNPCIALGQERFEAFNAFQQFVAVIHDRRIVTKS